MKKLLTITAFLLFATVGLAQTVEEKTVGPDVPEVAVAEIVRRGNFVQELGTISATELDLIADALAPPEDDSHKWFFTLVTKDDCKPCNALKAALATSPVLRAWVDVDNPDKSATHFQVRRWEESSRDGAQRDWFAKIKDKLAEGGTPAMVIQPPRNGEWGPNKTVVAIIHGYNGDPEAYAKRLRDAVAFYVQVVSRKGGISHVGENTIRTQKLRQGIRSGHEQEAKPGTPVGGPPPFLVPSNPTNPYAPNGPVDWPPQVAQGLTLDQLRALVPEAPAEFLLQQLAAKVADPERVKLAWLVFKGGGGNPTPAPVTPTPPPGPGIPLGQILLLLMGGNVFGLVALGLTLFRGFRKSQGKEPILDEVQFQRLLTMMNQLQGTVPAKNP